MLISHHGNGHGLDDLYILPEGQETCARIVRFLQSRKIKWIYAVSDVPGQPWYGKLFIEIPFGQYLEPEILNLA